MRSGLLARKGLRGRVLSIALILFLLAPVASPLAAGREPLAPEAEGARLWTFMVWLNGDNNLEPWAIDDINEMEVAGSTDEVAIVVQMDRIDGYDTSNGDWTTTKRFYVTRDPEGLGDRTIRSEEIADLGEVNMGDPDTLIEFVDWAQATYPAQHYALILWNHGSGWKALVFGEEVPYKAVSYDQSDGGDWLTLPELRYALWQVTSDGLASLDLVGFDACHMGIIEVDYEIMPFVGFRVGSEDVVLALGWPYHTILTDLIANPSWKGKQLSAAIVSRYHESYEGKQIHSATDLGPGYSALDSAVNDLATTMMEHIAAQAVPIAHARYGSQSFYRGENIDLYHFAERLTQNVEEPQIVAAANQVMASVGRVVVAEEHGSSWPGAHGIAIYYPVKRVSYDPRYGGDYLAFTTDGLWDDFLEAFYSNYTPTCHDPNEPNDDRGSATGISYGESVRHAEVCPSGDEDYYSFTGKAGETIRATVTAQAMGSSLDSDLFLYNASGVVVAHNNDFHGLDSQITYLLPSDGVYYLAVLSHVEEGGPEHFYTLELIKKTGNLLENGSFEEGDRSADGWIGMRLTARDRRVCKAAHRGRCSFRIVGGKANKRLRQTVRISGGAGASFTLTAWSKAKDPLRKGGPYCLEAKVFHTDGTKQIYRKCFGKRTHSWQRRKMTFTTDKAYKKIVVLLRYARQSGRVWFDDVQLMQR